MSNIFNPTTMEAFWSIGISSMLMAIWIFMIVTKKDAKRGSAE